MCGDEREFLWDGGQCVTREWVKRECASLAHTLSRTLSRECMCERGKMRGNVCEMRGNVSRGNVCVRGEMRGNVCEMRGVVCGMRG